MLFYGVWIGYWIAAAVAYVMITTFTVGFMHGKKWYTWDGDKVIWLSLFWPLFWFGYLLVNSWPAIYWLRHPLYYLMRYSPLWLAYDFGLYMAGAGNNKEEHTN